MKLLLSLPARLNPASSNIFMKTFFQAIIYSSLFTICALAIHLLVVQDSMFQVSRFVLDHEYLQALLDHHKTQPSFARRPLTTKAIEFFHHQFGLSIGYSVILVVQGLTMLSGAALFTLARRTGAGFPGSLIALLAYFLCFSNLFGFYQPVYTYDEPLQFTAVFIAILALLERKWWLYVPAFSLALIARESAILLLPALVFLLLPAGRADQTNLLPILKKLGLLLSPLVVYFIFQILIISDLGLGQAVKADLEERSAAGVLFNFGNRGKAVETITCLLLVLGPMAYLLWHSRRYWRKNASDYLPWIRAFLVTLLLNTVVVLIFTKAREARLFVLPLFFVWPIVGRLLEENHDARPLRFGNWPKVLLESGILVLLIAAAYFFSYRIYHPTIGSGGNGAFNTYLFLVLACVIGHRFMLRFFVSAAKKD